MRLATRVRFGLARWLLKAGGLSIVPRWVTTSHILPTWRLLVQDGYKRNATVFACVTALAFDVPEPPLRVYDDDGQELGAHPLTRLLQRPNMLMAQRELLSILTAYAAIGGNSYAHIVKDRRGQPVELWPYHVGQIMPIPASGPDAPSWIDHYAFIDGDGNVTGPIDTTDIIHLKWPSVDPSQPWLALPPLAAVAAEVDATNEAMRYVRALLKNDAMPRTVLTTPPGAFPDPESIERMKEQFRERYGADYRGDVAILEEGVRIERMSLDMQQLAFDALMRVPESHIGAAFRVPLSVAGIGDDPTYANSEEAYRRYVQSTLSPLWAMWGDEFRLALGDPFGVTIRHDLSTIAVLQDDQNALATRAVQLFMGGLATRNEGRRYAGLPEVDGGDVYAVPNGLILLTGDHMQVVEPPASAAPMPAARIEDEQRALLRAWPRDQEKHTYALPAPHEQRNDPGDYVPPPIEDVAESIARRVRRYLSVQYRAAAAALRRLGSNEKVQIVDQLPLDSGAELSDIMRRFYGIIFERAWVNALGQIGVAIAFDLANPRIQEVLAELATRVRAVTDTTRDEIRAIVGLIAAEGISVDAAADQIAALAGIHSRKRAFTIAVTESADAYSRGSVLAWRESGQVDRKQWIAEPDACPLCTPLDGEIAELDRAFSDGTIHPPRHPHCRCALVPVLAEG